MVHKSSQENKAKKIPQQRKTTLKWGTNGELSALDMVRILDRLNDQDLTECEIPLETVEYCYKALNVCDDISKLMDDSMASDVGSGGTHVYSWGKSCSL